MVLGCLNSYSIDTLVIGSIENEIDIYNHIQLLEDVESTFNVDTLLNYPQNFKFTKNEETKFNFGFSRSTYWLKLVIKNECGLPADYIMEISNPDLDYINFYEVSGDTVKKEINTGELQDVKTREIYHRNFLFRAFIEPTKTNTYLISAKNSGHSFFIPLVLKESTYFRINDNIKELFNWAIYGLLLFIVIFNVYLYRSTQDKVNLYYSLYVFFAAIFFIYYDGYSYFLNPPSFIEGFKWLYPSLYIVFLASFTQAFTTYSNKYRELKKLLNVIKAIAVIAAFSYMFKYPLSLIADVGLPILILTSIILVIIIAAASYNKKYSPSRLFLWAYCILFSGMFIHELKEFDLLPSNFFVENSIKIGLTLECILLTLAVLERFRINQENAKKTIEENYFRIEIQNKEFEIINTELEKLSIVASETDNSTAIYDNRGKIEWCNSRFEKLYDISLDELIKSKHDNITDIVPNENIKELVNKCLESKKPVLFETHTETKRKKEMWIQTTLSPFIRSEKILKIIAIDSDITNLKLNEKDLELAKEKAVEADRLKTVFLGNMSHEVRTPLNGIIGFSELLNNNNITDEKKNRYIQLIRNNGEQLIRIIDDIVDISLIESNQLRINPAEFELCPFYYEIINFFDAYKATIDKAHIQLIHDLRIKNEKYKIISDKFRLKQVIMNLLKNAFTFTIEGQIKFGCFTQGNKNLFFYVEDTGIGVDPSKKDIIFERFRQVDENLGRKYGGAGLGLSISKGLVEKLGGDIWIDSNYSNGLKICFTIPIRNSEEKIHSDENILFAVRINNLFKNKNILIVEDHNTTYEFLEEIFSPYKPAIYRAVNGIQAINMVKENNYDLVLMDINLPEMDGLAATKEIRKFNKDVLIIAHTAYAMESEKDMIMASGCNDLICKPINSKDFFEKLALNFENSQEAG
jgi:PAS domain S-box-containing protein